MKIFLSYSRRNAQQAEAIKSLLQQGGHKVWYDTEQIPVGADWRDELLAAIQASQAIALALSPDWVASNECQWELVQAIEAGKLVIPILIEPTDLPDYIGKIQYYDFTTGFDDSARNQRFLSEMMLLAQEIAPQQLRKRGIASERVSRATTLIIAALAVLVLMVGGLLVWSVTPEQTRTNMLNSVGLVANTATPTATSTPLPTSTPTPTPQPGAVVIAIAHFHNPADSGLSAAEGRDLINQMETLMQAELGVDGMVGSIPVTLRSAESLGCIGAGVDDPDGDPFTCDGATDEATRKRAAEQLAAQLNADIVLYGTVRLDDEQISVIPEFYVNRETFTEALEMTGPYRLGRIIEADELLEWLDRSEESLAINRTLTERTQIIAQIFAGLAHFSQRDYEEALRGFRELEQRAMSDNFETAAVLQLLIANSEARIASVAAQRGELVRANTFLDRAVEAYVAAEAAAGGAVDGRATYSRAYTGLASATYLRWVLLAQEQAPNLFEIDREAQYALLEEALRWLERASDADDQPDDVGIDNRSRYVRIQVLYVLETRFPQRALTELEALQIESAACRLDALDTGEQLIAAAESLIVNDLVCTADELLVDYGRGVPSLTELAYETYYYMGQVALDVNADLCPVYIESAVALNPPPLREMFMLGTAGDCHSARSDYTAAITSYNQAIDLAIAHNAHPDDLERYTAARDEAQAYLSGRG